MTALKESNSGQFRVGIALKVEEEVLVENEPALSPLARVGALLVQVSFQRVFEAGPGGQKQKMGLVDTNALLHRPLVSPADAAKRPRSAV